MQIKEPVNNQQQPEFDFDLNQGEPIVAQIDNDKISEGDH